VVGGVWEKDQLLGQKREYLGEEEKNVFICTMLLKRWRAFKILVNYSFFVFSFLHTDIHRYSDKLVLKTGLNPLIIVLV